MSKNKSEGRTLPIRRIWGETINLFLVGDVFAAVCLPIWFGISVEGISGGDVAQLVASCALLFLITLGIRAAVWGIGRLADKRILGMLERHALNWDGRRILFEEILAFRYRCFPCARLFRKQPSGLWLMLENERIFLARAPYWLRIALGYRCTNARGRATIGLWALLGGAVALCLILTVWMVIG